MVTYTVFRRHNYSIHCKMLYNYAWQELLTDESIVVAPSGFL